MTDLVARSYALTYGVPAVVARCGNIYGPGDLNWSRIVPGTFRSILLNQQPVLRSDGTFLRDYLHVDDVVERLPLVERSRRRAGGRGLQLQRRGSAFRARHLPCVLRRCGTPGPRPRRFSRRQLARSRISISTPPKPATCWVGRRTLDSSTGLANAFAWYERFLASNR